MNERSSHFCFHVGFQVHSHPLPFPVMAQKHVAEPDAFAMAIRDALKDEL